MKPYKNIKRSGVTYSEHKWVWEQANGPVPDGYVVHHINHVRRDNRLENLQLMTHEEHSRHHNDLHPRERICPSCGEYFEPDAKHRGRDQTCSWECRNALLAAAVGSAKGTAKLNETQVAEIRKALREGAQGKVLALRYGVSPATITRIRKGEGWRHVAA